MLNLSFMSVPISSSFTSGLPMRCTCTKAPVPVDCGVPLP